MNPVQQNYPSVGGALLGASTTQAPDPQKIGPVTEALSALFGAVGTAQKTQEGLEKQLAPVLSCYSALPFSYPGSTKESQEEQESSGCRLSDEIYELVRMVNSLVDRQEAMSRAVQL